MYLVIYHNSKGKQGWKKTATLSKAMDFVTENDVKDYEITVDENSYRNMKNDIELLENNILALKDLANKMELKH